MLATEGHESGHANLVALAVGVLVGGVAGYFVGRCARNDADGTTCRIATIVMNALGFGAPTTFVFVGAAAAGGAGH